MMRLILVPTLLFIGQAFACSGTTSFCSLTTASNPDWMARIPDSRNLAELSIPGTHESLAITGGDLTQCQENHGNSAETLTSQLNAGIRFFDIRLRITDGNKFTIHHGPTYQNANFDDVLNKFQDFFNAHSTEAVLVRLKAECTGETFSCKDASGDFETILKSYFSARGSLFWLDAVNSGNAAVPTMGQVRSRVVVAVVNGHFGDRLSDFGLAQFSGWHDGSSDFVQDEYNVPNLGAIATKRDQVRRFLDKTSAGDITKIYVNFGSGSSAFAYPNAVAGGQEPFWTPGVDTFLLTYLNQGADVHTPVVRTSAILMDFPGGALINKIISINKF
ncbi:1-phosphatidylinositol phosphodiesterase [Flagelloscypha sp. PMI_526]|nr:1-phosphatidylinositol phosphodiesterase [Flagelloscypha sp. PMI_526]